MTSTACSRRLIAAFRISLDLRRGPRKGNSECIFFFNIQRSTVEISILLLIDIYCRDNNQKTTASQIANQSSLFVKQSPQPSGLRHETSIQRYRSDTMNELSVRFTIEYYVRPCEHFYVALGTLRHESAID
jgi:hypothetical protein